MPTAMQENSENSQPAEDQTASVQEPDAEPAQNNTEEEKPAEVRTYACYEEGEKPADKEGEYYEDLNQYVDPATDKIAIRCGLEENRDWQVVEIITTDSAGNRSVDIREGSQNGTAESRRVFLITTDAYTRLINNMGVRFGAGGALVLAFLSAFLLRRRNRKSDC